MFERNYFGMMMVETGDADAFITGLYTKYSNTIKVAKEVIGIRPEYKHFATMQILNSKRGTFFVADTLINRHPDADTLIDVARLAEHTVRFFNHTPNIAMLSYSTKGSGKGDTVDKMRNACAKAKAAAPELAIDGEMQFDAAVSPRVAQTKCPDSKVAGYANNFIFPDINAGNIGYKIAQRLGSFDAYGPILQGLNAPINDLSRGCSADDIVGVVAITAVQCQAEDK